MNPRIAAHSAEGHLPFVNTRAPTFVDCRGIRRNAYSELDQLPVTLRATIRPPRGESDRSSNEEGFG